MQRAEARGDVLVQRVAAWHVLAHRRRDEAEQEERNTVEMEYPKSDGAADDGSLRRGEDDPRADSGDEVRESERDDALRTMRISSSPPWRL